MTRWLMVLAAAACLVLPVAFDNRRDASATIPEDDRAAAAEDGSISTSVTASATNAGPEEGDPGCVQVETVALLPEQTRGEPPERARRTDESPGPVDLESIDYGRNPVEVLRALARRGAVIGKGERQVGRFGIGISAKFDFDAWAWRAVSGKSDSFPGGERRLITEQAADLPQPGTTILYIPENLRRRLVQSSEGGPTLLTLEVLPDGVLRVETRTATQRDGVVHQI